MELRPAVLLVRPELLLYPVADGPQLLGRARDHVAREQHPTDLKRRSRSRWVANPGRVCVGGWVGGWWVGGWCVWRWERTRKAVERLACPSWLRILTTGLTASLMGSVKSLETWPFKRSAVSSLPGARMPPLIKVMWPRMAQPFQGIEKRTPKYVGALMSTRIPKAWASQEQRDSQSHLRRTSRPQTATATTSQFQKHRNIAIATRFADTASSWKSPSLRDRNRHSDRTNCLKSKSPNRSRAKPQSH